MSIFANQRPSIVQHTRESRLRPHQYSSDRGGREGLSLRAREIRVCSSSLQPSRRTRLRSLLLCGRYIANAPDRRQADGSRLAQATWIGARSLRDLPRLSQKHCKAGRRTLRFSLEQPQPFRRSGPRLRSQQIRSRAERTRQRGEVSCFVLQMRQSSASFRELHFPLDSQSVFVDPDYEPFRQD